MGAHLAALRRMQDVVIVCHLGYGPSLWEGSVQGDGEGAAFCSTATCHGEKHPPGALASYTERLPVAVIGSHPLTTFFF